MRTVAAGLTLVWLLTGIAIELASYLPFDPEWTDLATFALFGTSFLVGALGAFFIAPELVRLRKWPTQLRMWLKCFRWFSWTKGDSERHMDILAANALASALTPSPDAASTIRLWAL